MVRKLNESDDYIKISKDYDDLVLRSIQIAKEMGTEQIIFQSKDGFFGSILAKNGKPVSPLSDGDKVIGKIRLVNRAGKTDAVYVTDYPAVQESRKRAAKGQIKENFIGFDSDLKDEYRKYLDEISDRCLDISNLSDDIKTFLYTLSEIDDDAAYDCFKECIKGLASIEKKLAYINSHYFR